MEALLQLHVIIPEMAPDDLDAEIQGGFDDVHDLIHDRFPVPNQDVPSFDAPGMDLCSSLFELLDDNLRQVREIENQLNEWYPDASVFRSSYYHTFGEFRTPADPDIHIVLYVTNWGVQQPSIRWKHHRETLQAPPLALDSELFHADSEGTFAIDNNSGETLWEIELKNILQVPVGNDAIIIGNRGTELVALERASGEIEWRTEFDISDEEIIDSRVVLGPDSAYVGLRTGEVVELSLETGERDVLSVFDTAVIGLQMIAPGLVAMTESGEKYLLDSSGTARWPEQADVSPWILHTDDGRVYARTQDSLLALNEQDGSVEWEIDAPSVGGVTKSGEIILAKTNEGLLAVDAETGDQLWTYETENHATKLSNAVIVGDTAVFVRNYANFDMDTESVRQNTLHVLDSSDGSEIQEFELGMGDCHGLAVIDETVAVSAGGELFSLGDFPDPAL
jgi:outer membrane protein assembly factor BamB